MWAQSLLKVECHLMGRKIGINLQRWVLLFGLSILVLGIIGGVLLPRWAQPRLEAMLSSTLNRTVSIEALDFNPFIFKATLHGLNITDKGAPFIRFKSMILDVELASLWYMAPVFKEITLTNPVLDIARLNESKYNFSDLLTKFSKKDGQNNGPTKFSLNNIKVKDGLVNFNDHFLHTQQKITNLDISLPFISTLSHKVDEYIKPSVAGKLNGAPFNIDASSRPFSNNLDTQLVFDLQKIAIQDYIKYIELPNELKLLSAYLSGQLTLQFKVGKSKTKLLINGPLQLDDFNLQLKDNPLIKVKKIALKLKDFEPLAQKYKLEDVSIDGLDTIIEKNERGQLNWQQALKSGVAADKPAVVDKSVVDIKNIKVSHSRISYLGLPFEEIKLDAAAYSSQAGQHIPLQFSAKTAQGEQFFADLTITPQPFVVDGKIKITALQLKKYGQFIAPYFKGEINDGQLDLQTTAHFSAEPLAYSIKDTELQLQQFSLRLPQSKKPILAINELALKSLELDSTKRSIKAVAIEGKGGQLATQLLANGQLNFAALMPTHASNSAAPPWRVQADKVDMSRWQVDFSDQRLAKAPSISILNVSLIFDHLDTQKGSRVKLKGDWANRGLIDLKSDISFMPLAAKMALDIRNVNAAFLQPYFTKYLNISLARGLLSANGSLKIETRPVLNAHYRGNFSVNRFYAIDKQTSTAFLKWDRLNFKGIDAALLPLRVDVAEVALDKFFSRLILSPMGRLNLQDIMVRDGKQVSVAHVASEVSQAIAPVSDSLPPINIKKIIFSNGDVRYSDFFIKPNFIANLTAMTGSISGLSSAENARARLDLHGFVDKSAAAQLSGELNPLSKKIYLDLKGGVKNYDLTSASTYATKYAGYGVEKGKMSMDLAYTVENNKLTASNKIFLDQLTLSDEKIDGEGVTTLPVKFALSLLTDRRGQINLNLPVQGSLDDPEFSVGGIIWQMVTNVVEKIVTSPFDALASSFGYDSATLSQIDFAAGSDKIDAGAEKNIRALAGILADRPALKMDIQSLLDPLTEEIGLKAKNLQKKIRLLKISKMAENSQTIEDEKELIFTKDEYSYLLEKVYKNEKFTKPTNLIGLNKSLTDSEMEKLIYDNTKIKEDELYALGLRRALFIKAALLAAGVDETRIFLVKSKINSADDQKSRVKFDLK
jgi:hypothetical protein